MPSLDDRDLQAMQLANDYTLDPDERQRQIDALYTEPDIAAPPPLVDDPNALAANDNPFGLKNQPNYASDVGPQGFGPADPTLARAMSMPAGETPPVSHFAAPAPQLVEPSGYGVPIGGSKIAPPVASTEPGEPTGNIRFAGGAGAPGQASAPFTLPSSHVVSQRVGTNEFQPIQRTIQGAQPFDPELEQRQQEAEQAQLTGFNAEQVAAENARSVARNEDRKNQQVKDEARKALENHREAFNAALALKEREYNEASDDLSRQQAQKPFNANRFWDQKSTGDKIMTGIAMFLGTLGSSLAGSPNVVWDKIKGDISNDIDEQKAEYEARVQGAATKAKTTDTIYQQFKERGFTDLEAKAASLQAASQAVDQEFARLQDSLQDPVAKAKADQMRALMQQDIATKDQARQAAHVGTIQEVQRFDPERWVTASGGPDMGKALAHAKALEGIQEGSGVKYLQALGYGGLISGQGQSGVNDELQPSYIQGLGHVRGGSREANQLRKEQGEYKAKIAALNAAKSLAGKASSGVGAFGTGTEEYNQAQIVNEQLKKAGVEGIDVTKWTGDQAKRVQEYEKRANEQWSNRVRSAIIPGGRKPAKQITSAPSEGEGTE